MPTHAPDLTRMTVTQLAQIVRCKRETMRRRLDGLEPVQTDGRTRLYDSADALSRYYTGESLDLTRERARLAKAQAEAQETKNAQARRDLVPATDQDHALIALATIVSTRLQAVPSRVAPRVAVETDAARCADLVEEAVHEALQDLADGGDQALGRLESPAEQ